MDGHCSFEMCGGVAAEAPNKRLVRHEVALVFVMLISRHHLLFCQQYPTSTCVTDNGGVQSCWDNVTSSERWSREREPT